MSTFIPYQRPIISEVELEEKSTQFYQFLDQRRTIRTFSDQAVSKKVMANIIQAASTAPSGAHKQPWTFCAISDAKLKTTIRAAAEKEEYENYHGRMSEEWLDDLQAFNTDWNKPFIEIAPWIIVVFRRIYEMEDGKKKNNYYVTESVGLACGMLLAAIHQAGLCALTHTPSPMNFLGEILKRPSNERPFLLIPVGYPAKDTVVPDLKRKPLEEVAIFYE